MCLYNSGLGFIFCMSLLFRIGHICVLFFMYLYISGLGIYFVYGMRSSKENKPLSAYSEVISYGGTAVQTADNASDIKGSENEACQQDVARQQDNNQEEQKASE